MRFCQEFILIAFMLLSPFKDVQGKDKGYEEPQTSSYFVERDPENKDGGTATQDRDSKQKVLTNLNGSNSSRERAHIESKFYNTNVSQTKDSGGQEIDKMEESPNRKPPDDRSFPTEKIYCRKITESGLNNHGEVIEKVQHVCAPQATVGETVKPLQLPGRATQYLTRRTPFKYFTTSTPRGINCRLVMNSELNELGEIVDSVTEVCDPLPTTTRKPTIKTTTKRITTTPTPLVKICKRVMDSYLDEEGKIVDSVNIVCKLVPAT